MKAYKPLSDRVIFKPDPTEEVTGGGIVIPDTSRGRPRSGTIKAVGPGKVTETGFVVEPTLKVGDRVITHLHKGLPVEHGGEECLVMRESDVIAIESLYWCDKNLETVKRPFRSSDEGIKHALEVELERRHGDGCYDDGQFKRAANGV